MLMVLQTSWDARAHRSRSLWSQAMHVPRTILLTAAIALGATGTAHAGAGLPGTDTPEDRAAWRTVLAWPSACERTWQETSPTTAGVQTWRASGGRTLVSVTCFLGAYQGTQRLYLVSASGTPGRVLRLHLYRDPGTGRPTPARTAQPLGVLTFRSGRLELFDKARGVGDCGILSRFTLRGSRFVPTSTRAKACDSGPPVDPARWPKLRTLKP
jgi:hypothetical protein